MESACNVGKNLPAMQETWVWSLGWDDLLEKGPATHSSILTWRILWTVQSRGHKELDATKRLSFHFFHIHSVIFFLCSNPSLPLYTFLPTWKMPLMKQREIPASAQPSWTHSEVITGSSLRLWDITPYDPLWIIQPNQVSIQFLKFLFWWFYQLSTFWICYISNELSNC